MSDLTLDVAKAVVDTAVKYDVWEDPDVDQYADEKFIETASIVMKTVKDAAKNKSIAVAVLELLRAGEADPSEMSDETREAYTQRFGSNGHAPAVASEPPASGAFSGDGSPEPESDSGDPAPVPSSDISDIFPGYDDLKVADIKKAILDSAASGDLNEEEWERIKAYESEHEDRKTIRELQPVFKTISPESEAILEQLHGQPEPTTQEPVDLPSGHDPVSAVYLSGEPTRAAAEGLPLPQKIDHSQHPPILPIDITTVSDQELSRVATQFHSAFSYAQWLQSQEEGRERAAEHLEHEAERDAYIMAYEAHKSAIPEEKRSQPTALDAARKLAEKDAEMAVTVRKYRSAKVRHGIDARELKALASGYDKAVWRINEEMGRRSRLSTTARAAT